MRRSVLAVLALCAAAGTAAASPKPREPWYRGESGRKRILHLSVTVGSGLVHLATQTVLQDTLVSSECRWCQPPGLDRAAREAFRWDDTRRADILSSISAYVIAPTVAIGLLVISDHDASPSRLLDDTIPVVETIAITQLVVQALKYGIARQRPYARYGTDVVFEPDQHLSFPSGHSSLGFAITAAAGSVAHWRRYKTEPYVWGAGIFLSLSTEYLRMAADKHYLSDVVVGGAIGIAGGLVIPRLMREDLPIVPVKNGVAVVGRF